MVVHTLNLYSVVYGNCTVFVKKAGTSTFQTDRRTDGEIQDEVYRIAFVKASNAIGAIGDYIGEKISVEDTVNGVALSSFDKTIHYGDAEGTIGDVAFVSCY